MQLTDPTTVGMNPDGLARLDAAIQGDIDAGKNYGAAVLVARGGRVVHRSFLGSVAPGRPAAASDRYLLMSMSKSYTALLVLRAIEAGRFGLDTRVAEIVPEFAAHGKDQATIAQMLCHTAGLPAAPVPAPLPLSAMGDLKRTAPAIAALKPVYPVGTKCVYTSGTGYDMLGEVLVRTDPSNRAFHDIAREDLFEPLGLSHTSFGLAVDHPDRVPVSNTPSQSAPVSEKVANLFNTCLDQDADYPCAGAFADIDDVFAFTEALAGRGPSGVHVLNPELRADAAQIKTGSMPLEAITTKGLPALRQALSTFGLRTMIAQARSAKASTVDAAETAPYPANFTWLGGYARGVGDYLNPAGTKASPDALAAMGGGSTGWMIDPQRDLTFVFLSAGLVEGFDHPRRLQRLADLAIDAVDEQ